MNTEIHAHCIGKFPACLVHHKGWLGSKRTRFAWLPALLLFVTALSSAQQPHPTESQVKSAYLYNFGKFVTWPVDRVSGSDTVQICVLGQDPFGKILDSTVAGENIDGRKITIKRLSSLDDDDKCNILFISSSQENQLRAVLVQAQHLGILTVSDMPHFAERGGVIGFVTQQERIRFEVNRKAAEQSHLVLSSELLKVASKIIEKSTVRSAP